MSILVPDGSPERSPPADRRTRGTVRRGGRRWSDDPEIAASFEHVALDIGRTLHRLREGQAWSQNRLARAAGLHANTVESVERLKTDPQLSTLVRLFFVLGYEVRFAIRRPRPKAVVAT